MTSPYFTAADLAHIFHLSTGSIYRMASQDHWRRTRYRPVRYHMDDARTSYTTRHKPGTSNTRHAEGRSSLDTR